MFQNITSISSNTIIQEHYITQLKSFNISNKNCLTNQSGKMNPLEYHQELCGFKLCRSLLYMAR